VLAGASSEQCLLINFPSENVFPIFPFASTPFSDASSFPHPRFRVEFKHIIQFQAEAYTEHPLGGTIDAQRGWQRRAEEATMIYSIITLQSNTNVSQFELNFFSLLAARLSGFVLGQNFSSLRRLTVDGAKVSFALGRLRKRCVIFCRSGSSSRMNLSGLDA
jgi:hypothetical protein